MNGFARDIAPTDRESLVQPSRDPYIRGAATVVFLSRDAFMLVTILLLLSAWVVGVVVACYLTGQNREAFTAKWPAIDDDEFVRRCPPGTRRRTALKVRRILADQLAIPYEHIHPQQRIIEDLNAD